MSRTQLDKKFAQVAKKIDPQSSLLHAWELKGGVSAQVTALVVERSDGLVQKMLVRQHGMIDLKHNPHIAADEFKLLQLLHSLGLPVPMPYYFDQSGEIFSTPYIVIEYVEGRPAFELAHVPDLLFQCATHLSRIHQLDCSKKDVSFLPLQANICSEMLKSRATNVDGSAGERRICDALQMVWPISQQNQSALLHGDFWPGNILWRDGQLVAIIDWEDARLGDPLADVANSRLEILWAFGVDAMQQFTRYYQTMSTIDWTNLPLWDLFAALRSASQFVQWADDASSAKIMLERHHWFVMQALEKLSSQ